MGIDVAVLEESVVVLAGVCFDFVLSAKVVVVLAAATSAVGRELVEILFGLELNKEMRHSLENWTSNDVPLGASARFLVGEVEHKPEQVSHHFGGAFQFQSL